MAQPMTLVATPDPEPTDEGCPELVPFCSGVCREYNDGYHSSDFTYLKAKRWNRGRYRKTQLSVSVYREATKNRKLGKPKVTVITDDSGNQISMSPARARMLAAHLLNAADQADPIPLGVSVTPASGVRMGDQLLTGDGWQTVVGQMVFDDQTNVWTDVYNRDPETDGWKFDPADPVKVRRPLNTGDPVLNRGGFSAVAYCTGCSSDRLITGARHVSKFGVLRVRGCCQSCGKRQHSIVAWSLTGDAR
jgi:hypothetical protein